MQATSQWCFSQTKSEVALRGGPRLSPGSAVPQKRRSHKDRWKEVAHEQEEQKREASWEWSGAIIKEG